jgi:tetratricopeptide (TPR) repeat protein
LALGLFGSAAYAPVALERSAHAQAENRLPESLRWLETAAKLNAWDARVLEAHAVFLERLYVATQDKTWRSRSDEVFVRALDLERTDGQLFLRNAERSTLRLDLDGSPEAVQQAEQAWRQAKSLLPYNAFEDMEEGLFWLKKGDKGKALEEFGAAAQKEPNFAMAWMNAGMLLKQQGRKAEARLCFGKALEAYDRWKGAERIDPVEKRLVDLSPEAVKALRREAGR